MSTHIYHYNVHSEQRYFLGKDFRKLFNLIALNGNIVSHTPSCVAAFLATVNKDFFIDPQTHAFQHPTINLKRDISDKKRGEDARYEFKPSIQKLAIERLGGPFAQVIEDDRPVAPTDFISDSGKVKNDIINNVCEKVIYFQKYTMVASLNSEEKEFISESSTFVPKFIIAPYFYLTPINFKEWLKININCYLRTRELEKDIPIYLNLVISKDLIFGKYRGIIKNAIKEIGPSGILLWIDDHIEEKLSEIEVRLFMNLLRELRNCTGTIYNLHGGYLSTLLCHSDSIDILSGVGHSINYGEHRSVIPVGGGIPLAHFYYPDLHSRLRFADALGIILTKKYLANKNVYQENVCSCKKCVELLSDAKTANEAFMAYGESNPVTFRRRTGSIVEIEYPTQEAKDVAAIHYLYNKAKEFDDLKEFDFSELMKQMLNAHRDIMISSGEEYVSHLINWHNGLQRFLRPQ